MKTRSLIPRQVRGDQSRLSLELGKRGPQGCIALTGRPVEAVVGGHLSRRLPDRFHRIKFRRIRRQPVQFDASAIRVEPGLALVVEPVCGTVVDDHEHLPRSVFAHDPFQILIEGATVENVRKPVGETGVARGYRAIEVSGLSLPKGIDTWLVPNAGPSLVEGSVEPEACLVLEEDNTSTRSGFFLMAGNRWRSHRACASASARASRLRGRWTENPN